MLAFSARTATLSIATLALAGSLALSQQPPAQPVPSAAPAPAAGSQAPAPPARRMRPMPQGGMRGGMSRGPMQRGPMMQRGGFRGGPGGHFRDGEHGGMEMGGFHMGPGGMWWKSPRTVERLSLTADQTKRMDDIVERSRLDLIDLRANLEKEQVRLGPIMDANPVNTAAASAQIDKVANARADLEKANAKMLLSIRGVLTPDQWTKLHERPTPPAQGAAPAGGPGAAGGPPAGGGRWRGGRPGGPGGNGMDNFAPPVDEQ
jgi:Spy/CpxP family protein refolding chaperone